MDTPKTLQEAADIIHASPVIEEHIPNTELRLFHVWKQQILSLHSSDGLDTEKRIDRLVSDIYEPLPALYSWLMPKEEYFRQWAEAFIPQIINMETPGVQLAFQASFHQLFTDATEQFRRVVNSPPTGDWYLVFADGGDLGGSGGTMFANLLNLGEKPEEHLAFMLPHEFNHQVYHTAHSSAPRTLVRSIVEEGLCCFINKLCWEGQGSPAKHLMFSDEAWSWSLEHEDEVIASVLPILTTRDWDLIKKYHQWHVYPWPGAVDRLAYFLGYRLCETYIKNHGNEAWQDFYTRTPEDIWAQSGYVDHVREL